MRNFMNYRSCVRFVNLICFYNWDGFYVKKKKKLVYMYVDVCGWKFL